MPVAETAPVEEMIPAPRPRATKPAAARFPDAASASDQRRWVVDQLRLMGVPNRVLGRIVLDDLDWAWNKRGGEVSLQTHGDPDTMAALKLENASSLDSEMRAALGEEGFLQWDHENMQREANRGRIPLSTAEAERTYGLWKQLQKRELELKKAVVKGDIDDADAADAFARAASEYELQLKGLLGEARYAKSQGLDELEAATLWQNLAQVNSSDSQFQALLNSQKSWNEQRAALDKQFQGGESQTAYAAQIKALDAAREEEYRRVLGDTVFETLNKQQDASYNQMKKHQALWELDDSSINSVYGTMKYYERTAEDYQAQARALEADGRPVDWNAVSKNLEQFARETEQALQDHLGKDRFDRMARNGVFQLGSRDLSAHVKPSQ